MGSYIKKVKFAIFFCFWFSSPVWAVEKLFLTNPTEENWEPFIKEFRSENHLGVSSGPGQRLWEINHFGQVDGEHTLRRGYWSRITYSFHLPLAGSFGYVLGSEGGGYFPLKGDDSFFEEHLAYLYPGLVLGLVYNFSPRFRLQLLGNANLLREDKLTITDPSGQETKISVTFNNFGAWLQMDYFFALAWAVQFQARFERDIYFRPTDPGDRPTNANLKIMDRWMGIGILYHHI